MKCAFAYPLLALPCLSASDSPAQKEAAPISHLARELEADLKSPDPATRERGIEKYRQLGAAVGPATRALWSALRDRNDGIRLKAVLAVAEMGPSAAPDATGHLIPLLRDQNSEIRAAAAGTLGIMASRPSSVVLALISALKTAGKDKVVQMRVIGALGRCGHHARAAVPSLVLALKDNEEIKHNSPARNAVRALNEIGPAAADAVPHLLECLKSDDRLLQSFTIEALGGIGPAHPDVLPTLFRLLKTNDPPWYPDAAALALGRIGPKAKAAVPDLLAVLKSRDAKASVRAVQEFVTALALIAPEGEGVVAAIAKVAGDKNAHFEARNHTFHTLRMMGPAAKDAVPALLASFKESFGGSPLDGQALKSALVVMGAKAVPGLIALLGAKDGDRQIPRAAAGVLGQIGPDAKAAIPALKEAANSTDQLLREAAAAALKKIQAPE